MVQPGDVISVKWAFMERYTDVIALGDKVAYTWTCGLDSDSNHTHVIECLWVWHDCDLNLNPVGEHWTEKYVGWKPTGVAAHDLISAHPLHIEASIYWPTCCGLHGWIRDGRYIDVNDPQ